MKIIYNNQITFKLNLVIIQLLKNNYITGIQRFYSRYLLILQLDEMIITVKRNELL